jgi:hypothetical protein
MSEETTTIEKIPGQVQGGDDRRKHRRLQCSGFAEVAVEEAGLLFRGSIRDLSLTGCFILPHVRMTLRGETEAELRFSLEGEELMLRARVKMTRPNGGIGFKFQDISPPLKTRLGRMVKKLSIASGK